MKPKLLAITAAMILITSATANAGDGFLNKLGRHLGYGISDGYHAQRYCPTACTSCNSYLPVQQPLMPVPMTAPAYSQYTPYQPKYVGHPVASMYKVYAPNDVQPAIPALANPNRGPTPRW